jgi:hypothetical protein
VAPTPIPPSKNSKEVVPAIITPIITTNFKTKTATYSWPQYPVSLDTIEKKRKFDSAPTIHAVLMGRKVGENKDTIISFACADCSLFSFDSGSTSARSQCVDGVLFQLNINVEKPFLPKEDSILYDPVILNIER